MKYETEMQIFTHYYTGKYSDSTLAQFRCAIMQFLTYVEQPMPRITEEHIGNWMIYLVKKNYSKKTIFLKLRGLILFFNCFVDMGIIKNHVLNECLFKPRFQTSNVIEFNLRKLKKEYSGR